MIRWFKRREPTTLVEFENYWGNPLGRVPWDGPLPRVGERVRLLGRTYLPVGEVAEVEHRAFVEHFAIEGRRCSIVRITVVFPDHAERMAEAAT